VSNVYHQYANLHAVCPECKGHRGDMDQTCVGYSYTDLATARNGNSARCGCGWSGVVHDLVPEIDGAGDPRRA
jgi:hypothetical protein